MALELCTVSGVVAWTGASTTNATIIANAVEARIGQYCNRMTQGVGVGTIWTSGSRTEYLTGEMSSGVLLKWTPITAIASVTLIINNTSTYSYTLTDLVCDGVEIASLSTTNARNGWLQIRSGIEYWDQEYMEARRSRSPLPNFGAGRERIKVAYTGGFSTIPDDLKLAALILSKTISDTKSISTGVQSESLGNYSYTNASAADVTAREDVMGSVKDLLQPYRSYANIV